MAIRFQGKSLIFMDLHSDDHKVQVLASADKYQGDFEYLRSSVKRGDIVGVEGFPGRSSTGELSIRPVKITSLSYCLHQLPTQHDMEIHGLTKDTRYR